MWANVLIKKVEVTLQAPSNEMHNKNRSLPARWYGLIPLSLNLFIDISEEDFYYFDVAVLKRALNSDSFLTITTRNINNIN